MARRLTDAKLRGLQAPGQGQSEYSDSDVPGLRVRIGTSGTKSFILRKRVGGRLKNITLGRYGPRFGLAEARKKARSIISDLEAGLAAPTTRRDAGISKGTMKAMLPPFLDSKVELRSHREIKRVLESYVIPRFGDRLMDTVTRGEVTELIDEIAASAPTMARAVHAQLSSFYTWAMPRLGRLAANPCRDAGRPAKTKARDRVLTDDELRALWSASDEAPAPWGPGLKLLMLTGARKSEVFNAERTEFDLTAEEWIIPPARAKNGQTHIVPLSKAALEVLKGVEKVEGSKMLFPALGNPGNGPSGFSKWQSRFRSLLDNKLKREKGEHWTLHDIRRTVATGMQRLGIRFEVTEAVLNHVSGAKGGVAGVYQRHDWKHEKREALNAWARRLQTIVANGNQDHRSRAL